MTNRVSPPTLWIAAIALLLVTLVPSVAPAGGGPENVFLVVNSRSLDSLTIANHYVRLRNIPACNVFELSWPPAQQMTDVDTFREKILGPIFAAIKSRRLSDQIDYVVYSSDFPWGVKLDSDVQKFLAAKVSEVEEGQPTATSTWPQVLTPVASLNGLTYLHQSVAAGDSRYLRLLSNRYARVAPDVQPTPTVLGFRSLFQFGPQYSRVEENGESYMLSTMLAVTAGKGNTVPEVLRYLRRAAEADGTKPKGVIYFVRNNTKRSIRHGFYDQVVKSLENLGVEGEIVGGFLPQDRDDVQGLMTGAARFDWPASGSKIRPGAICEHLTSWGGRMSGEKDQTLLSEFLRHGAAGASGTVTEPYAVPHKFPLATMQLYYAAGCTLAESFYQALMGPYQLLIVGDPLCRPWASIPVVKVEGVEPGAEVSGKITLTPSATSPAERPIRYFELFVDGWRRAACRPGESFDWDTAKMPDGRHEFRIVAVEDGPIATQGRAVVPLSTSNHGRTVSARLMTNDALRAGKMTLVELQSPGARTIYVLHNSQTLGKVEGEKGNVVFDPVRLGLGPSRLQVLAVGPGGPLDRATAEPIDVHVTR